MDKIEKFLLKLSKKHRALFLKILADVRALDTDRYDIKALTGMKGVYRLRKGDIRIVFLEKNGGGIVLDMAFRKDIYNQL